MSFIMIRILSERANLILKSKKELEANLKIKISNKGKIIELSGNAEQEYIAEKVILAINFSFPIEEALLLKDEEVIFEIINIKDIARSKNFERIRGRVIGAQGKTLKTLSTLTDCYLKVKDNQVGIIGYAEAVERCIQALNSLIKGSKWANVYSYLEKHHPQPILDYGIREPKKKSKQ